MSVNKAEKQKQSKLKNCVAIFYNLPGHHFFCVASSYIKASLVICFVNFFLRKEGNIFNLDSLRDILKDSLHLLFKNKRKACS